MISKDQANRVADELLSHARAGHSPPRLPPRLLLNQFRELELFEPSRRGPLLRQAMAAADRQWPVLLACFLWLSCSLGAIVFLLPESWKAAPMATLFILCVPFLLVRRAYIRRQLIAMWHARPGNERGAHAAAAPDA